MADKQVNNQQRPGYDRFSFFVRMNPLVWRDLACGRCCQRMRLRLSLLRIAGRVVVSALPTDVLSARFVGGLLLPLFVLHDALLGRASLLWLRHARLSTMLTAHILAAL
jgi:hypothetical protein